MSWFRKNNLIIFPLALLVLPLLAEGKIVEFGEKNWEVPLSQIQRVSTSSSVRNDLALKATAISAMTGKPIEAKIALLDKKSVDQIEAIITVTNQLPKSANLIIEDIWAKKFEPGQDGQAVDVHDLYQQLLDNEAKINLPVLVSLPQTKLADTNDLGINGLVAVGESDFSGSPKNRIHNITVGASRYNGLIIKPGEEFSFNKFLGDVDAEHGFLPELVIKRTGLVPEFGGGLCQVSSTVFRSAMKAGLPITERRNHSFAVRYYAPQGTDATIYPGVTDLRFINNLSSHLLIRTRVDGAKLYFDFFGTKDTRIVELEGPTQYDKKPDGSLKAVWSRKVTLNNQTSEQTFRSNYLPPALFQTSATTQPTTPNPAPPPLPPPVEEEPVTTTNNE